MLDIDRLYFEWLLTCLEPNGALEGSAYVGALLHNCVFRRRVGNDVNRAMDGVNLRSEFIAQFFDADFSPSVTNHLMSQDCSWFEMMVALSRALDYLYDGGVEGHFLELITNLTLDPMLLDNPDRSEATMAYDQRFVDVATSNVDTNNFDANGHGGIFPLATNRHLDQRGVEIWDQQGAYFSEKLEGILWPFAQ